MESEFDEQQVTLNDYNLSVSCAKIQTSDEQPVLCVQLSDVFTGDSWKATFEPNYIEELTRKTGNFKSFQIFVNMLKTAMNKKSTTVTLEILTYNDLEQLRLKKTSSNMAGHNQNVNINKRYLILTYNVEFDRINYPLQLNYQGKTDVNTLVNTIRNLRNLVKSYETRLETVNKPCEKMRKPIGEGEIDDREELTSMVRTTGRKDSDSNQTKLLKQIIKTIEEKSLKEKNLLQKQLLKRKQEIDILKQQLSESKLAERNLRNEVRMLSNEVRMLKRPSGVGGAQKRSSSCESLSRLSDSSGVRRQNHQRLNQSRSSVNSRNSSRNSSLSRNGSVRNIPSPAPSLSSINSQRSTGRFNPTEYVRNRKLKLEENEMRRKKGSGHKRADSKERTQLSGFDSDSDVYSYMSFDNDNHLSQLSAASRSSKLADNSKQRAVKSNAHQSDIVDLFSTHQEMKEIDAKLKSLQLLIKNNSNI